MWYSNQAEVEDNSGYGIERKAKPAQRCGALVGIEEGRDKRRLAKRRLQFIELHNINTARRPHELFYTYTFNQAV